MHGPSPYLSKVIGRGFEAGLNRLKAVAEAR